MQKRSRTRPALPSPVPVHPRNKTTLPGAAPRVPATAPTTAHCRLITLQKPPPFPARANQERASLKPPPLEPRHPCAASCMGSTSVASPAHRPQVCTLPPAPAPFHNAQPIPRSSQPAALKSATQFPGPPQAALIVATSLPPAPPARRPHNRTPSPGPGPSSGGVSRPATGVAAQGRSPTRTLGSHTAGAALQREHI